MAKHKHTAVCACVAVRSRCVGSKQCKQANNARQPLKASEHHEQPSEHKLKRCPLSGQKRNCFSRFPENGNLPWNSSKIPVLMWTTPLKFGSRFFLLRENECAWLPSMQDLRRLCFSLHAVGTPPLAHQSRQHHHQATSNILALKCINTATAQQRGRVFQNKITMRPASSTFIDSAPDNESRMLRPK